MSREDIVKQVADRVREALDDAERRAGEIVRAAEEEANRIRTQAEAEARNQLDDVRKAIDQLQGVFSRELDTKVEPGPVTVPEPEPPPVPEPEPPLVPEPEPPPDEATPPSPEPPADAGAARLVALKLALDGAPREQVRQRLAADYPLADVDSLLDDVYAKAGKSD
jgi:outer membrane biosynthesis protein TonB